MEDRPRFQTGPREIRPSGIIGGPRETWPGWSCAPTSHTERSRMVTLHLYTGAPELYPNNSTPKLGKLSYIDLTLHCKVHQAAANHSNLTGRRSVHFPPPAPPTRVRTSSPKKSMFPLALKLIRPFSLTRSSLNFPILCARSARASWIAAGFVSSSRKRVNRKTAKVGNLACQARQSTRSSSLSWRDSGPGFDHLICNFPQPCLAFVDRSHDGRGAVADRDRIHEALQFHLNPPLLIAEALESSFEISHAFAEVLLGVRRSRTQRIPRAAPCPASPTKGDLPTADAGSSNRFGKRYRRVAHGESIRTPIVTSSLFHPPA